MKKYQFCLLISVMLISCSKGNGRKSDVKVELGNIDSIEVLVLPEAFYEFHISESDIFLKQTLLRYVIEDTMAINQLRDEFNKSVTYDRAISLEKINIICKLFIEKEELGQILFQPPFLIYETIEKDTFGFHFNENLKKLLESKLPRGYNYLTKEKESDAINLKR
ncbi:MAG: hypothetical protein AAF388_08500 [Bacteroidota bacterium]